MRSLLILPALTLLVACGSSGRLTRKEAERDIRKDYPVTVTVTVKAQDSAIKGSREWSDLVALAEALGGKGGFAVERRPEGDREAFTFRPSSGAPAAVQEVPGGYELPAAVADFVRATKLATNREGGTVSYQVRLTKALAYFPVFQKLHPKATLGALQERHATYVREKGGWILDKTDERYKKAQ